MQLMQPPQYLRSDVIAEPTIDRWFAWSHLISPVTSALNLSKRYIPVLESFIEAAEIHEQAVKDPKMLGGPFVDLPPSRSADVREMLELIRSERAHLLELAEAINEADKLLLEKADGGPLEPLYPLLPEVLRGFIELVYDLNDQASIRLVEPLLYASKYHDPTRQRIVLSIMEKDERPFVTSTPRFPDADSVEISAPFSAPSWDKLFAMKRHAVPFNARFAEEIGVSVQDLQSFEGLLTETPPRLSPSYEGTAVRWRYFGHACILVETSGFSLLVDPVLSYAFEGGIPRYTYNDLPDRIDLVLITHNHQDHISIETMLQLRHKIGKIVVPRSGGGAIQDPSLKLMLESIGFDCVVEMDELEAARYGDASVVALPFFGEHGDMNVRSKAVWLVEAHGHRMLFAADACNIEPRLYERVREQIGSVDAIFVGMECDGAPVSWLYGPLRSRRLLRAKDKTRRLAGCNFERARALIECFECSEVYVYAMGLEPWLRHIIGTKYTPDSNPIIQSDQLMEHCRQNEIICERLFGEKEILTQ